jgi:hypothetical protein
MTKRKFTKTLTSAAVLPVQTVLAVLTSRDLNRRHDVEVGGSKRLWRAASSASVFGSAGYWAVGRKQQADRAPEAQRQRCLSQSFIRTASGYRGSHDPIR